MEYQLKHSEFTPSKHDLDIVLIADNLQRPSNYGMLIRVAESLGVKEIVFISQEYKELTTKMKRSSRSAENNIIINLNSSVQAVINKFSSLDYLPLGLEYTSNSQNINEFNLATNKLLLVVGSEAQGLSEESIANVEKFIHLPMYGKNSSMNVVVAASIALWELIHG